MTHSIPNVSNKSPQLHERGLAPIKALVAMAFMGTTKNADAVPIIPSWQVE